jgi:MtN3 and saliva related transmembrane protein
MIEAIGWLSSSILLATIGAQIHKQWQAGTSKGVSTWLFVGQCAASLGFLLYSFVIHNWVFVVTNGLMALAALVGLAIVRVHRRREGQQHEKGRGQGGTDWSENAANRSHTSPR